MKNMSKFQLILTAIFGAFILIGVIIFAFGQGSNSKTVSTAVVWGTMGKDLFESFLKESGLSQDKTIRVTYVEKNRDTFDQEFIEALAIGLGPDIFFLPQNSIIKHQDKIFPIPYSAITERVFKDTFIQEGELFLTNTGVLAMPFMVDPMVMYWNRDLFSNFGLGVPPKFWTEFYDLSGRLTTKDNNLNITKSVLSFGEFSNVVHATEIISLLTMQAGSPITVRRINDGSIDNLFNQKLGLLVAPAEKAINFYTEFSNPLKPFYSWNRSLPDSKSFFLSGDLAVYFGFASELTDIRLKNPNLNFDVAPVPQVSGAEKVVTFGKIVGLAIPKNSKNIAGAYQVASKMIARESLSALARVTNLPPVRHDLITDRPAEAFLAVFYNSAIQARGWIAPEPQKLNPIFRDMIESVTAGRASVSQVLQKAHGQLDLTLIK